MKIFTSYTAFDLFQISYLAQCGVENVLPVYLKFNKQFNKKCFLK